jgi:hypothetical protein
MGRNATRVIDRVSDMSDWDQSAFTDGQVAMWDEGTGTFIGIAPGAEVVRVLDEELLPVNGSNAVFTTDYEFVPASVEVTVNGLVQTRIDDFNTSGTQTITLTFSPATGELVRVCYQRA